MYRLSRFYVVAARLEHPAESQSSTKCAPQALPSGEGQARRWLSM
jgi:hypothetical protein